MRDRLAVLLLLSPLVGCSLPTRDNPSDPTNLEPPDIRLTEIRTFTCRQWIFPFVSGHDGLQDSVRISAAERAEIDAFCDEQCPSGDPGGPPPDPGESWTPNACHSTLVYAGAIGVEDDVTASCDVPQTKAVQEEVLRSDAPSTVDVVVYARVNGTVDVPVVATTDADASELRRVAIPAKLDDRAFDAGYPGLTTLMTTEFRRIHSEGVLLTRSLSDVDRFSIQVLLSATRTVKSVEQRGDCSLTFRFEQAVESFQHPLGLAGGYGRSVSLGDLDLEKDGPSLGSSQLEIATSYRISTGVCYADLVYRDATTRAHHWGQDGNAPISVPCRGDGEPPAVTFGRFLESTDEALAIPVFDGAVHRVEYWAVGSAYTIAARGSVVYADTAMVAPDRMVNVGDLDGDGLSELGVVTADQAAIAICSASGSCTPLAASTCNGAPVERIVAIAESPFGVSVPALALLAQSADETCLQQWTGFASGLPVSTETVFTTRPDVVAVHWTVGAGGPIPVIAGAVGALPELLVTDVDPQTTLPRSYPVVGDGPDACDAPLAGTVNGIGVAAGVLPSLLCGDTACEYQSGRVLGMPAFDLAPSQGGTVADAGAVAIWQGDACVSGAYVLDRLEIPGVLPTRFGASISARPDLRRARREQNSIGSRCVVPPVMAVGAPAGGATGGAGHVIVVYPAGAALENPSCTDVAWP